jgi:heme A synthase
MSQQAASIDRLRPVRIWLWTVAALVAVTVIVGGATRLTGSGLSITEWRPVTGVIPPLTTTDWLLEFDKYRTIPQFLLVNPDMTLAGFKFIYWWEWAHRMLGRLIGSPSLFHLPCSLARADRSPAVLETWRAVRARRAARRDRLVDGEFGTRRADRREPVPAGDSHDPGLRDFGGDSWRLQCSCEACAMPPCRVFARARAFSWSSILLQIFVGALVAKTGAG